MPEDRGREVLVLRGHLDRAGVFTPSRMRSTPHVKSWPVVEEGRRGSQYDVRAELLDERGEVLHREPASVTRVVDCAPGDPRQYRVLAYIGLREDAVDARLVRDDLVLWQQRIPEPAALELSLRQVSPRKRVASLSLAFSEPATDDAHLTVVYAWGERRFEVCYLGPAEPRLDIDLTDLPGGEQCRFLATYSNGMRSAQAVSDAFEVATTGPVVTLVRPEPGDEVRAGAPVVLEGNVVDRERIGGARADEDLWWLVDGEPVGRGPITSVDGLPDGDHVVELVYRPEDSKDDLARTAVEVRAVRGRERPADEWPEWDPLT